MVVKVWMKEMWTLSTCGIVITRMSANSQDGCYIYSRCLPLGGMEYQAATWLHRTNTFKNAWFVFLSCHHLIYNPDDGNNMVHTTFFIEDTFIEDISQALWNLEDRWASSLKNRELRRHPIISLSYIFMTLTLPIVSVLWQSCYISKNLCDFRREIRGLSEDFEPQIN